MIISVICWFKYHYRSTTFHRLKYWFQFLVSLEILESTERANKNVMELGVVTLKVAPSLIEFS